MSGEWRDEWDRHATAENDGMDHLPIAWLVERVRRGEYGDYHTIWHALARRASLHEAGWALFAVLERPIDYLHRYHAASALLELLGNTSLPVVALSSGPPEKIAPRLREVAALLEAKIGPRI